LVAAPWTVCSGSATDANGTTRPTSALDIGVAVAGRPMNDADAVLVRSLDGQGYLVWHGHRLTLTDQQVAAALGYQARSPTIVADAWLSAVPAGPDLRFPDVRDQGAPGPTVGALATRVGQVLVVRSPGVADTYYLVVDDGLSALTALGAALVVGDPASRAAYPGQVPAVIEVSAADVAASTRSAQSSIIAGYPTTTPSLVDGTGVALCARFDDPSNVESPVTVSLAPASLVPSTVASARGTGDVATADVIRVPVDHGVVAQAEAVTYLITDLGIKYPLATDQLLPTLGLSGTTPTSIASTLLSLIPTGPVLDPAKARLYQHVITAGH
jgi:type VII secretion protein EccB